MTIWVAIAAMTARSGTAAMVRLAKPAKGEMELVIVGLMDVGVNAPFAFV